MGLQAGVLFLWLCYNAGNVQKFITVYVIELSGKAPKLRGHKQTLLENAADNIIGQMLQAFKESFTNTEEYVNIRIGKETCICTNPDVHECIKKISLQELQ